MRHHLTCFIATVAMLVAPGAWALDAEYAVRWYAGKGGPNDLDKVVSDLALTVKKRQRAQVTYLLLTPTSPLPEGQRLIGRERVFTPVPGDKSSGSSGKGGEETEVMIKLRALDARHGEVPPWDCPMSGAKSKQEIDVSWTPSMQTRAASSSCKVEGKSATEAIPVALKPQPDPCSPSSMVRARTKQDITVEQWTLPSGQVVLEVSMSGKDNDKSLETFRRSVVDKLKGIEPIAEGMTTLATSSCPAKK